MQEIRWFKPSIVYRRFSVIAGFYRTCVLDGALEHSPAEHVRRPAVPAESPTLGFTHLQFEALLAAARQSPDPGRLRTGGHARTARLADLRSHQRRHHRPRRRTRPPGPARVRQRNQGRPRPASARRWPGSRPGNRPPGTRAGPAQQPRLPDGPANGHPPPAAPRRNRRHPDRQGTPAHAPPHVTTMLDAGVDLRDVQIAARHADPRHHDAICESGPARTWTATRTTSSPPTWRPAPDPSCVSRGSYCGRLSRAR